MLISILGKYGLNFNINLLRKSLTKYSSLIFILLLLISANVIAQDTTKSLAFKKNRPYKNSPYYYQPDLSYQLLQQFKLIQEANAGDPLAQHELGMRLLLGEGMAADTSQAIYWIKQAADQNLSLARYNYGVMLINGFGTMWNPFEAYHQFKKAAEDGMGQSQYVMGILYTDNLIVRRDFNTSYYWLKKAVENGYKPAEEALKEVEPKISQSFKDSVEQNKFSYVGKNKSAKENENSESVIEPSLGLVFIDFNNQSDTITSIASSILIDDLLRSGIENVKDTLGIKEDTTLTFLSYKNNMLLMNEMANAGSPEALTIMGRVYQEGKLLAPDLIIAAEYYVRGTILDSQRSAFLLWKLTQRNEFLQALKDKVDQGNSSAAFVWYGLRKLGYDNSISLYDAAELLKKSASKNHIPSIIELGYDYYTGNFIGQDKNKGLEIWDRLSRNGNIEAGVRLSTAKIFDNYPGTDYSQEIKFLEESIKKGSILAQVALAYCYERGFGVARSMPNAAKYYRSAAQRGNQFAYEQLKRLYDQLRPESKEFIINNQ